MAVSSFKQAQKLMAEVFEQICEAQAYEDFMFYSQPTNCIVITEDYIVDLDKRITASELLPNPDIRKQIIWAWVENCIRANITIHIKIIVPEQYFELPPGVIKIKPEEEWAFPYWKVCPRESIVYYPRPDEVA